MGMGNEADMPRDQVQVVGERPRVRPGEKVPADGVVLETRHLLPLQLKWMKPFAKVHPHTSAEMHCQTNCCM